MVSFFICFFLSLLYVFQSLVFVLCPSLFSLAFVLLTGLVLSLLLSFTQLFPSPLVLPDLSSHLKYFLPGLMEHRHGDCVMSLHGELLPRKLYDVIALETVAMVTELIEVTGNKGVVIRPEPGNAPFNGNNNKKKTLLMSLRSRAVCLWFKVPSSFSDAVCSIWASFSWTELSCSSVSSLKCYCGHHATIKWKKELCCPVLLCNVFPSVVAVCFFLFGFFFFLWWIGQSSYYPSWCQRYANSEYYMSELASSAPGSVSNRQAIICFPLIFCLLPAFCFSL